MVLYELPERKRDKMSEKIQLICPVCGDVLLRQEKSYSCRKKHSFDIARQGYVNLLPVQNKHSLSPGDTVTMLNARRNFLKNGYYLPICDAVCSLIKKYTDSTEPVLLDIGCGEGYYTSEFEKQCNAVCIGTDISKDAVRMSCASSRTVLWTVATASHLPVADESTDVITAIFSLFVGREYARVLRKGGIAIEVTAGSSHLIELKRLIYDEVYVQNKQPAPQNDFFDLLEQNNEQFSFTVNNDDLQNLLLMTPHVHRIKKDHSFDITQIDSLSLTADLIIRVLRKK